MWVQTNLHKGRKWTSCCFPEIRPQLQSAAWWWQRFLEFHHTVL